MKTKIPQLAIALLLVTSLLEAQVIKRQPDIPQVRARSAGCSAANEGFFKVIVDASSQVDCDTTPEADPNSWVRAFCWCSGGTLAPLYELAEVFPSSNAILESMLKAVDSASDEECLTYESTVGDFEWQTCNPATVSTLQAHTPQTVTCTDSGDGSAGAVTITPTANLIELTNADADGCAVTMGESAMVSGTFISVVVVSTAGGSVTFSDTSGVSETAEAFPAGPFDSISFVYTTTRWVETGRSSNKPVE